MAVDMDGLYGPFRQRVESCLADPEARRRGLYVVSAFRSIERQKALFDAAVRRYGSVARARKWVAPPGRSNHGPAASGPARGKGIAVDFGIPGIKAAAGQWPGEADQWMQGLGKRHGLRRPMAWEDWHYEHDFNVNVDVGSPSLPTSPLEEEDDELNDTDRANLQQAHDAIGRIEQLLQTGTGGDGKPRGAIGGVIARIDERVGKQGLDLGWLKELGQKLADKAGATIRKAP